MTCLVGRSSLLDTSCVFIHVHMWCVHYVQSFLLHSIHTPHVDGILPCGAPPGLQSSGALAPDPTRLASPALRVPPGIESRHCIAPRFGPVTGLGGSINGSCRVSHSSTHLHSPLIPPPQPVPVPKARHFCEAERHEIAEFVIWGFFSRFIMNFGKKRLQNITA